MRHYISYLIVSTVLGRVTNVGFVRLRWESVTRNIP